MNLPINRRKFQTITALSSLGLAAGVRGEQVEPPEQQVAFLSDTHISADPNTEARGIKMAEHLEKVVGKVVDTLPSGSHVIVNGDCAYLKGLPEDYATFAKLMRPIMDANLRLHVTMGNHDDRGPLYQQLSSQKANDVAVEDKHVDVIRMRDHDLVLLDSLWKVNQVTGKIGSQQIDWLNQFLSSDSNRPVLVIGHHNMQFTPPANGKAYSGVQDTSELTKLLERHPKVKAYFYGHTHRWENRMLRGDGEGKTESLHLINLPAVAYVFDTKQPSGWVHGTFSDKSLKLKLHSLDSSHPNEAEEITVSL